MQFIAPLASERLVDERVINEQQEGKKRFTMVWFFEYNVAIYRRTAETIRYYTALSLFAPLIPVLFTGFVMENLE